MPPPDARRRGALAHLAALDVGLLVASAGLTLIGVLLTWSATRHSDGSAYAVRGALNAVVGMGLAALALRTDGRTLRAAVPALYLAAIIALLLVLSPLGCTVNGSRSWIELPGFSVQPAEIAKVALAVGLASALADTAYLRSGPVGARSGVLLRSRVRWRWPRRRRSGWSSPRPRGSRLPAHDLRVALVLTALPLALILAQPDLGSALVVSALAFITFAVAGMSRRLAVGTLAAVTGTAVVALTTPLLAPYQRDRLLAFVHPDADPSGIGYQVAQVKLAIGSGGVLGQGLFHGRSTQGGFIPFQYTDFAFSVAGEELGLIGALGIVLLEGFLIARTVTVALRTDDAFGRLLCAGVAGWLLFQTLENIGMNLGVMPVTGVPLPFVSYGGSSLFSCWFAIGLVGNVHSTRHRRIS